MSGLVEKVARAIMEDRLWPGSYDGGEWTGADLEREACRREARAAIAVVLEAAAKVADDHTPDKHSMTLAAHCTGRAIAAAIRAMKEGS